MQNELMPLILADYERLNLEETGTVVIRRSQALPYGTEYFVGSQWVTAVALGSKPSADGGVLNVLQAVRMVRV